MDVMLPGKWIIQGLGVASAAMGLVLLAPARAARLFGLGQRPQLMAVIGARDLTIGLGLLAARRPSRWLYAQLLADVTDCTIVGLGLLTGSVARWRGGVWILAAITGGWASLHQIRRLNEDAV